MGVAALTFLLKAGGGLCWLIPAAVASVLGGVVNAWLLLAKVTGLSLRPEHTAEGARPGASKVTKNPSPAVSISRPPYRSRQRRTAIRKRPTSLRQVSSPHWTCCRSCCNSSWGGD